MIDRDLCVVGHGRGATSYAAEWLQRNGLDCAHERMGTQGIVDSAFAVPGFNRAWAIAPPSRDDYNFKAKMCIVRNPWLTIATYDMVEHPRAVWEHARAINLDEAKTLLPAGFSERSKEWQEGFLDENRAIRLNAIALSVVRWTSAGMEWAEGFKRAEDQWDAEMPSWLEERGLWTRGNLVTLVHKNQNHRPGKRLSRDEILEYLLPNIAREVSDFALRCGYGS